MAAVTPSVGSRRMSSGPSCLKREPALGVAKLAGRDRPGRAGYRQTDRTLVGQRPRPSWAKELVDQRHALTVWGQSLRSNTESILDRGPSPAADRRARMPSIWRPHVLPSQPFRPDRRHRAGSQDFPIPVDKVQGYGRTQRCQGSETRASDIQMCPVLGVLSALHRITLRLPLVGRP
jgi:hypothetical protein